MMAFELSGVQFGPKSYTRDLFEITSVKHDFRPKLHDTTYNYLAKKSSDPKIIGIKTNPFWKFQPENRLPKILGDLYRVKIL